MGQFLKDFCGDFRLRFIELLNFLGRFFKSFLEVFFYYNEWKTKPDRFLSFFWGFGILFGRILGNFVRMLGVIFGGFWEGF